MFSRSKAAYLWLEAVDKEWVRIRTLPTAKARCEGREGDMSKDTALCSRTWECSAMTQVTNDVGKSCWGGKRTRRDQVAVIIGGVRWAAGPPPQGSVHWWEDSLPSLKHGQGRSVYTVSSVNRDFSRGRTCSRRWTLVQTTSSYLLSLPWPASEKRVRNILCVMKDLYVSGTRLFLFSCSILRTLILWQKWRWGKVNFFINLSYLLSVSTWATFSCALHSSH